MGGYLAGLWKGIKLCEQLQRLGIDARMIKENCLALIGQSIDMVRYYGGPEFDPISRYDVDYGVRGNVKDVEDQVRVQVMIKTKGILSDELKWVRGRRTVGKSEIPNPNTLSSSFLLLHSFLYPCMCVCHTTTRNPEDRSFNRLE